jgi:hypothetical protein
MHRAHLSATGRLPGAKQDVYSVTFDSSNIPV